MSEKRRTKESYAVGLGAIAAMFGLSKVVEGFRDTPERRQTAYRGVISSIDALFEQHPEHVTDATAGQTLDVPMTKGLTSITRRTPQEDQPATYTIDRFETGDLTHKTINWETDGITGIKTVTATIQGTDPRFPLRDQMGESKTLQSEWKARDAEVMAARFRQIV